ncbi:hypothetical protein [Allorhodopirellula solitaria]|uniref:Uncharacterized protein n=1 Tax=Allorhodopirellula solitaria TaxID=2527987 RepID=A0A5C5XVL0_9BACT|nr:hypothetical protein [Allorhodopirellula solitaria]TWT67366.1 hypothetical protein CA85_22160 [Allorhodopirellula solitaria]
MLMRNIDYPADVETEQELQLASSVYSSREVLLGQIAVLLLLVIGVLLRWHGS